MKESDQPCPLFDKLKGCLRPIARDPHLLKNILSDLDLWKARPVVFRQKLANDARPQNRLTHRSSLVAFNSGCDNATSQRGDTNGFELIASVCQPVGRSGTRQHSEVARRRQHVEGLSN